MSEDETAAQLPRKTRTWIIAGGLISVSTGCGLLATLVSPCSIEPNGCGPLGILGFIVPECPLGVACFTSACNAHDACYTTCQTQKVECDEEFYSSLKSACEIDSADEAQVELCLNLAYIYWQVVVRFGSSFFDSAQQRGCACSGFDGLQGGVTRRFANRMSHAPPFEDADNDLLPDEWERLCDLDPTDPSDALENGEGRSGLQDYLLGRCPSLAPSTELNSPEKASEPG